MDSINSTSGTPLTTPAVIRQFAVFAAVGVVGTVAHYAVLISLVQLANANAVAASAAGFVVGALVNYALNYQLTFRSSKQHSDSMPKFFAVAFCGLVFNTLIMEVAVGLLKQHYLPSQLVATATVLLWNFSINRIWTFRR